MDIHECGAILSASTRFFAIPDIIWFSLQEILAFQWRKNFHKKMKGESNFDKNRTRKNGNALVVSRKNGVRKLNRSNRGC